jgi:hypothetical protein
MSAELFNEAVAVPTPAKDRKALERASRLAGELANLLIDLGLHGRDTLALPASNNPYRPNPRVCVDDLPTILHMLRRGCDDAARNLRGVGRGHSALDEAKQWYMQGIVDDICDTWDGPVKIHDESALVSHVFSEVKRLTGAKIDSKRYVLQWRERKRLRD